MIRSLYFTYLQQYQKQYPDQFEDITQSDLDDFLAGRYHEIQGKEYWVEDITDYVREKGVNV